MCASSADKMIPYILLFILVNFCGPRYNIAEAALISSNTGPRSTRDEAKEFCAKLFGDERFAECQSKINLGTTLENACSWNYLECINNGNATECGCGTVGQYATTCVAMGISSLKKWRDENFCPLQCSGGRVHTSCAPSEERTCKNINFNDNACQERCYCPAGFVIDNDVCIHEDKCPCELNGVEYVGGTTISQGCNTCLCTKGTWKCTKFPCKATCSAIGDPHYTTLDGKKFDFMGNCSYYLVMADDFEVIGENAAWYGTFVPYKPGLPTSTKSVTVKASGYEIKIDQGRIVTVDGIKITSLPRTIGTINIYKPSSNEVAVQLPNGVLVRFDGTFIVYVTVPRSYREKTKGLCGNYNDLVDDDFKTPDGVVVKSINDFGNSWKTEESCPSTTTETKHPCNVNPQNRMVAERDCKVILSSIFSDCHPYLDPKIYYDNCVYDTCACLENPSKCVCPMIKYYADECQTKGVLIEWRTNVDQCTTKCTGGQTYQMCAKDCHRTCLDVSANMKCNNECVEDCRCPSGQVLNSNGNCIPVGQCSCQLGDKEYSAGEKVIQSGQTCSCENANWKCTPKYELENATCSAIGDPHYTTFDGKKFDFMGNCSYYLVMANDFEVIGENAAWYGTFVPYKPGLPTCTKSVTVKARGYEIKIDQGRVVTVDGIKITSLPRTIGTINIYNPSSNEVAVQLPNGVLVRFDGTFIAYVTVPRSYSEKTKGLCGNYNDLVDDDFKTPDGVVVNSINDFGNSWKTDESCPSTTTETKHPCNANPQNRIIAERDCKVILSSIFSDCHPYINPQIYYDNCVYDTCACLDDPAKCVCPMMKYYADECKTKGVLIDWRSKVAQCATKCTGGQTYQICAKDCHRTCLDVSANMKCNNECVEDCRCPSGQVLNSNGNCIPVGQCSCQFRGKEYSAGEKVIRSGQTCSCENANWKCTPKYELENATCSAIGDPHYTTFDGKKFDFMGNCSYYLVMANDFEVIGENAAWYGTFVPYKPGLPTCTKSVTVKARGYEIKIDQGRVVTVDGIKITSLPRTIGTINIYNPSSNEVAVQLPNGVLVRFDGTFIAYVTVPRSYSEKTKGLCGNYNDLVDDDFKTPDGVVVNSINDFGNSWKTDESCPSTTTETKHPCNANPQNRIIAERDCKVILSSIFSDCHPYINPQIYYDNCVYDTCACLDDPAKCVCPMIKYYADECKTKGVLIDWRSKVAQCATKCTGGQTYQVCAKDCHRTCLDVSANMKCNNECVEDCRCLSGLVLNGNGNCIPVGQCSCQLGGKEYSAGEKVIQSGQTCSCEDARWKCTPLKCSGGRVYTSCAPSVERTCKNINFNDNACQQRCYCPAGYVIHNDVCVPVDKCPCELNGVEYIGGSSISQGCDTCLCTKGAWKCTNFPCNATCSAIGDPHYTTLDGRKFDFMGHCSYYLVMANDFEVIGENAAWYGTFVPYKPGLPTSTKSVIVKASGYEIKIDQGRVVTVDGIKITSLPRTIGTINIYNPSSNDVAVQLPNGVLVRFDGTFIAYVTVPRSYRGKTKGLCGNYNDLVDDDFKTRDGVVVNSINDFGNSWKTEESCPSTTTETKHPCNVNPQNRIVAERDCKLILSNIFSDCHRHIDPQIYYDNCVYDTCACLDNPSKCVCPMLKYYADQCRTKGVLIDWRSKIDQCAIHCTGGQTYQTCAKNCHRTCLDVSANMACNNECVEDCRCLSGLVLNGNGTCIPVGQCSCQLDAKEYSAGEKLIRSGQICSCENASWNCMQKCELEYESFYDDCNSCKCIGKKWSCTNKICRTNGFTARKSDDTNPSKIITETWMKKIFTAAKKLLPGSSESTVYP